MKSTSILVKKKKKKLAKSCGTCRKQNGVACANPNKLNTIRKLRRKGYYVGFPDNNYYKIQPEQQPCPKSVTTCTHTQLLFFPLCRDIVQQLHIKFQSETKPFVTSWPTIIVSDILQNPLSFCV